MSVAVPSLIVYVNVASPATSAAGVNVIVAPVSATAPPTASPTAVMVSGSPSTSVSLASKVAASITCA